MSTLKNHTDDTTQTLNELPATILRDFERKLNHWLMTHNATDPAHNSDHILRVVRNAKQFAIQEGALLAVVIPAAYLHDCVTLAKHHPDSVNSSSLAAKQALIILREMAYPEIYLSAITHAIKAHSYRAAIKPETIEAKVVQDADRLDALGAIGIARCIQVGSHFGASLYDAKDPLAHERSLDDKQFIIDHFAVKLFSIAETMHTSSAHKEAQHRMTFMHDFLQQLNHEVVFTTSD